MTYLDLKQWAIALTPTDLPKSFNLYPHLRIIDRAQFLAGLKSELAREKPVRDRFGVLESDLRALYAIFSATVDKTDTSVQK